MLRSPNLNVVIKSLEKVSIRLGRDFIELENLQSNNFSAVKFANSCYKRVEETLIDELKKVRGEYNFELVGGRKITNNPASEYQYIICPIDGLLNLSRSIPSFTSFVALEHLAKDGTKEIISSTIINITGNEFYICEKGSGVFLNNRKIRVSKRELKDGILCGVANQNLTGNPIVKDLQDKKAILQISNCASLDVAYFAAGKIDLCIFDVADKNFLKSVLLLAKEAGGEVIEKDGLIIVSNGLVKF
ncbi:MAG: monophosphatase [Rickettsiaceae bacterium]|jgi:myo-inositol-1(or 4)-monophosphatase|nr:monophosphatase [Rickettsiaceae bacterium]